MAQKGHTPESRSIDALVSTEHTRATMPSTRTRNNDSTVTIRAMIEAGLRVALRDGFHAVSNNSVARESGKSASLVTAYFINALPGMPGTPDETADKKNLKCEVLREAIRIGRVTVVERALGMDRDKVLRWPPALKRQANEFLNSRKSAT